MEAQGKGPNCSNIMTSFGIDVSPAQAMLGPEE